MKILNSNCGKYKIIIFFEKNEKPIKFMSTKKYYNHLVNRTQSLSFITKIYVTCK